jgi:hypothetical protein
MFTIKSPWNGRHQTAAIARLCTTIFINTFDRLPMISRQQSPTEPARCSMKDGVGTFQTSGSPRRISGHCGTSGEVGIVSRVPARLERIYEPHQLPLKLASSLSSDQLDVSELSCVEAAGQPLQPSAAALAKQNGGHVPNDRDAPVDLTPVVAVSPNGGE